MHHSLELLSSVLRQAPDAADIFLRKQCSGLIKVNYELVIALNNMVNTHTSFESLALDCIAKTEEVFYVLIRRFPSVFYQVSDNVANNDGLFPIFVTMTKDIPSLLSAYAHISTFYLFLTKDASNKLANKLNGTNLLTFITSIVKVLRSLCTNSEQMSKINVESLRIDFAISNKLERIIIIKSAHYLLLSLIYLFRLDPQVLETISSSFCMKMLEKLEILMKFAETNFKNQSQYEDSYVFLEEFKNTDIKMIPGSRNYLAVDFEYENEDMLFEYFYNSVMTWV